MLFRRFGQIRSRSFFEIILLVILVSAFVALGVRGVVVRLGAEPRPVPGPYATSDSFLAIVNAQQPSEVILRSLTQVPDTASMVFVAPAAHPFFIQTFYVVEYLSWPRRVSAVGCGEPGMGPVLVIARAPSGNHYDAAIYFHAAPSDLVPASTVGTGLALETSDGTGLIDVRCP